MTIAYSLASAPSPAPAQLPQLRSDRPHRHPRLSRLAALLALAAASAGLSACAELMGSSGAVPAPAEAAAAAVPASLPSQAAANQAIGTAAPALPQAWDWQQLILDPRLQKLTELALAHNLDLRLSVLAIDAARAQYRITEAEQLPTVNASVGSSATRGAVDLNGGSAKITRQVSAGLGITSWELDLWGRLEQLKDSAKASYLASEASRDGVRASLVAELAQAWLTLAADQQLEALARASRESQEQTLRLTQQRHQLGAASALDLATAQGSAESARLSLASASTQVAQDLNALRLLLGTEPPAELLPVTPAVAANAVPAAMAPAAALMPVPAELPSSVLLRRPDVQAAEQKLLAARANLGAARAALFPTLSLTAAAGTASNALSGLFGAGNGTWSFAPTLKLPIFDGGSSRAALDAARVAEQQQLATYQQVVQTAFKEVADALAVRASLAQRLAAQQSLVQAQADTLRLTRLRQQLGAESSLTVATAERALWSAQQSLISLQLSEQSNRLTLFKALGGS